MVIGLPFARYDRSRYQSVNSSTLGALARRRLIPTIMTYFFFGTLMDRDVLVTVLDRPVAGGELRRAWLHGYQRVRAATAPYPVLVPAPGVVVEGVVFSPKDRRDDVRIRHFEEGEYVERWLAAHLPGGRRLTARVFLALEGLGRTDQPWCLTDWAREHKAAFLEQCQEWMHDCPACAREPVTDPVRQVPMLGAGCGLRRPNR
jgi:Gamma-glutamyl cyclotransferase, AIG2-like